MVLNNGPAFTVEVSYSDNEIWSQLQNYKIIKLHSQELKSARQRGRNLRLVGWSYSGHATKPPARQRVRRKIPSARYQWSTTIKLDIQQHHRSRHRTERKLPLVTPRIAGRYFENNKDKTETSGCTHCSILGGLLRTRMTSAQLKLDQQQPPRYVCDQTDLHRIKIDWSMRVSLGDWIVLGLVVWHAQQRLMYGSLLDDQGPCVRWSI